jgi:hypothetical protein
MDATETQNRIHGYSQVAKDLDTIGKSGVVVPVNTQKLHAQLVEFIGWCSNNQTSFAKALGGQEHEHAGGAGAR